MTTESGAIDIETLFDIVFDTIEHVVNGRSWEHAFMENGFHPNFARLSNFIMKRLEYTEKPIVNVEQPTLETFTWCFPGRTHIPENLLLKPWRRAHPALPAPSHAPQLPLSAPPPAIEPPPQGEQVQARGSRLPGRRDRVAEALAAAPLPWTTQLSSAVTAQTIPPDPPAATNGRTLPWRLRSQN